METIMNRELCGKDWKQPTLLEVWTTGGQWASLWSGTSPVWAADKAPSGIHSLEECLSAGSKCSSWPPGPGDPLKTDTAEKPTHTGLETKQSVTKESNWFPKSGWLNIYSQRSGTPVSRCNSIHYGWSPPPNMSRERNHKLNLQFLQQRMLHLLTTVTWPTKQWNSLLQLKTKLMLINVYFKHIHTDSLLCYEI